MGDHLVMADPELIKKIFMYLDEGYTVEEISRILDLGPKYIQDCIDFEESK